MSSPNHQSSRFINLTEVLPQEIWENIITNINQYQRRDLFASNSILQEITLDNPPKTKTMVIESNLKILWSEFDFEIPSSSFSDISRKSVKDMIEVFINMAGLSYSTWTKRVDPSFTFNDLIFTPTGVEIIISYESEPDPDNLDLEDMSYKDFIIMTWYDEGAGGPNFSEYYMYSDEYNFERGPELEHPPIEVLIAADYTPDDDDWSRDIDVLL